ncbi:hypothetical protein [Streptomyces sp. NPDC014623]
MPAPRWELALVADDVDAVAGLAPAHGQEARGSVITTAGGLCG